MEVTRSIFVLSGLCALAVSGCMKHEAAAPPAAPPATTAVATSEGPGSVAAAVTTTATVVSVDQKTRMVTLRNADNELITFRADESIRNLPQVRKGDQVSATYYESIALTLRDAEGEKPSVSVVESTERAPLGAMPAATAVRQTTLTAKVTAIDKKKQTVTLEGPKGNSVKVKVQDPRNLERAQVGHLVEVVYREAVAISVAKPN